MFFIADFFLTKQDFGFCLFLQRLETSGMRAVAHRNGGVHAPKVEGEEKSLLPSAVQHKLNPNNFIGIIASE